MQSHSKFKTFVANGDDLIARAEAVLNAYHIAPKSLSVEYLEHSERLAVIIGYREDEPPQPFKLKQISLGRLGRLNVDARTISEAMEQAAKKALVRDAKSASDIWGHLQEERGTDLENIICHEFYVDNAGEFFAVFLIV